MKYKLLLLLLLTGFLQSVKAQHMNRAGRADTSSFSVNQQEGWAIFNSYVQQVGRDSVLLEIILRHDRDTDWSNYQYVGRIKNKKLIPASQQEIDYYLLSDGYKLKIDQQGKCYISLVSGQLPAQDPVVLPVRVVYKRTE